MINGLDNTYLDLTNVVNLNNVQDLKCQTIATSNVSSNQFDQLRDIDVTATIQQQINSLILNGGCFPILATQNSGFIANTYWGFSSGTTPAVSIPLVFGYSFRITSITITCQTLPTNAAKVKILFDNETVYTMEGINTLTQTYSDINIDYVAGLSFNIFTESGGGGGLVRMTVSCQVGSVQGLKGDTGDTPQLSIGSVTQTNSPTVNITGTSTNPVLNFGLPSQPNFSIGNVINGSSPNVTISGSLASPILNFQLQKGDTGPQGAQGQKGDKGDKGDTGGLDATDAAAIAANTTGLAALGGTVAGIASDVGALDTAVSGLTSSVASINEEIDALQGKTQYITTNVGTVTTQITSNFQVGNATNPGNFKIDFTTGKLDNRGDITVRNSSGSSTINLSNDDGTITSNTLNCSTINCDNFSSNNSTSNLGGSSSVVNIKGSSIYIGESYLSSTVYINNLPFVPFSSASSFFSQW